MGKFVTRDPNEYYDEDMSFHQYVMNNTIKETDNYGTASDSITISMERTATTGNIEWLIFLLESTQLSAQQTALTTATINLLNELKSVTPCCNPCILPEGTRSFRGDIPKHKNELTGGDKL